MRKMGFWERYFLVWVLILMTSTTRLVPNEIYVILAIIMGLEYFYVRFLKEYPPSMTKEEYIKMMKEKGFSFEEYHEKEE